MKRFVDLGRQLWVDEDDLEMPRQFAFYCTVVAEFESFSGQQVFDSWEDFALFYDGSDGGRYKCLCPPWVFGGTELATPT